MFDLKCELWYGANLDLSTLQNSREIHIDNFERMISSFLVVQLDLSGAYVLDLGGAYVLGLVIHMYVVCISLYVPGTRYLDNMYHTRYISYTAHIMRGR